MLWGGLDWQAGSDNPYTSAQTKSGGTAATPGSGNIGVRRATLYLDRATASPGDDDATIHFDWLNITGGNPDDSWIDADYTTLETAMIAFWTSYKANVDSHIGLREIRWHRVGAGVTPPNPATRVYLLPTTSYGASSTASAIPQIATSITFRTAVRRSWGRTYLPLHASFTNSNGRLNSTQVDTMLGYANTMVNTAASSDFHLVVTSLHLSAALVVEKLEMDDVVDVVRRRRWKHTVYRKLLP